MLDSAYLGNGQVFSTSSGRCTSTDFGVKRINTAAYERLKTAIEKAHPPTAEHSIRVRICAESIGEACSLSGKDITTLSIAAEVHDIGKLRVSRDILDKKGILTPAERAIIEMHPEWGMDIAALAFPAMPDVAESVLLHHERVDGSGYPYGLKGLRIPLISRILAVADVYVALTEDRTFRPAYSEEDALKIMLHEEKGRYDNYVLRVLEQMIS